MVIDQLAERLTDGKLRFDEGGAMAAKGACSASLLEYLLRDPYLKKAPPKTTGREAYGADYVERLLRKAVDYRLCRDDILATATRFTAECVAAALRDFCPVKPDLLIAGGGGCRNRTLMRDLRSLLDIPVLLNEDLGLDSDAKEAVAFAVLANECVHGNANNLPSVTGASHQVVMGKISL